MNQVPLGGLDVSWLGRRAMGMSAFAENANRGDPALLLCPWRNIHALLRSEGGGCPVDSADTRDSGEVVRGPRRLALPATGPVPPPLPGEADPIFGCHTRWRVQALYPGRRLIHSLAAGDNEVRRLHPVGPT
jgi:hypothetical protein